MKSNLLTRLKRAEEVLSSIEPRLMPQCHFVRLPVDAGAGQTQEEVLSRYIQEHGELPSILWFWIHGGPQNRPLDALQDRHEEETPSLPIDQRIIEAVEDLKSEGFTEEEIEALVEEPGQGGDLIRMLSKGHHRFNIDEA